MTILNLKSHPTSLKGLCHLPRPNDAGIDEKHFEIVGTTFSNTIGEFKKLFSSVSITFIFRKLAECFIYIRYVITEAVGCNIFESFSNGRKAKILQ